MPRQPVRSVHDMEIDEISLVDRPANQHARVAIAKRAPQEVSVPEYFTAPPNDGGELVDLDALEVGDVIYAADGTALDVLAGDEADDDDAEDDRAEAQPRELESVGKGLTDSAFGRSAAPVRTSLAQEVREALAKAATEDQRDEVIAKALDEITKADQRASRAESIAKSERDLRLGREYVAKAAEYNVPIEAEELGPVLMRMADALSFADCAVIHKALSAAGEMLFVEAGYSGEADMADPMAQIEAQLAAQVSKSGSEPVSKHQAVTDYFSQNPAAYDSYRASLGS